MPLSKSSTPTTPATQKTVIANGPPKRSEQSPVDIPNPKTVQQVFRSADNRPQHDAARLLSFGVQRFESKRLVLFTDIAPEIAERIVNAVDHVHPAWIKYFGELPLARDGSEFRLTGYIMRDKPKFQQLGLIPPDLPQIVNGRHRGYEFWMMDQKSDYYRRHLIIHEATHCFMTILEREGNRQPVWYLEGMAELFGTHQFDATGQAQFRLMPHDKQAYPGLGRITMIQVAVEENRALPLDQVFSLSGVDFLKNEPYAWAWALCQFLDKHPRYQTRFQELGRFSSAAAFTRAFRERFESDRPQMDTEWRLFITGLQDGYDVERSAIAFVKGTPLSGIAASRETKVVANRGWQSSKVMLEKGRTYVVAATGRVTLATQPKPWISEPQGISFRYDTGQPLGRLLACVHADGPAGASSMLTVIPIGQEARFAAPSTGTLYLRVNDSWSELSDNSGEFSVMVTRSDN
ncbi:MAG: hypothetical protein O3A00_10460 [Planctomycetota bacterium]|nr:hypothetical protein [Planctomycetota bacterium]